MPTLSEFDNAFARSTRFAPGLKRLEDGHIALLESGVPRRTVGSQAVVYRYQLDTGGTVAVRCFLADQIPPAVEERYQQAANPALFRRLRSVKSSPLVQRVAWIEDAVLLQGEGLKSQSVPVVAMEWIAGPTVFQAVDVATRKGHGDLLTSVAEQWLDAMSAMREVGFAHGSLSPSNALIERDRGIVLVDYDNSWWPGLPDSRQGLAPPGYRHPRGISSAPERRDDFAALVHYVSLRALASFPEMRTSYGDAVGVPDPALLFDQRDLDRAEHSPVFQELQKTSDREVKALAGILREAIKASPDETPAVADAHQAAMRVAVPVAQPPKLKPRDNFKLAGNNAVVLSTTQDASPDNAELEKIRSDLERALATGDATRIMQLWPEVASNPAFSRYALAANALIEEECQRLMQLALASENEDAIQQHVALSRKLGVPVPSIIHQRMRKKNFTARTSITGEANNDVELQAGLAAIANFSDSNRSGRDEAGLGTRSFQFVLLRDALQSDDDRRILLYAAPELMASPALLTPEIAERVALARTRSNWRELVRRALRERDYDRLVELTAKTPQGGKDSLSEGEVRRIDRAITQRRAILRLREAMASNDDRALIDAMNEIEASGAMLPPELEWSSLRRLADRLSLVSAIRKSARSTPPDYDRLGRLLPSARVLFGEETPYLGVGLDFVALELEMKKEVQRRRILDALARRDDVAVAHAASPDPHNVVSSLPAEQRQKVEDLLERLRKTDPLKAH